MDVNGGTSTFSAPGSDPNARIWYEQKLDFQAIALTTTLTFSPPANTALSGFWDAFIDDVRVLQTSGGGPNPGTDPVPVPSTLLLLGARRAALGRPPPQGPPGSLRGDAKAKRRPTR